MAIFHGPNEKGRNILISLILYLSSTGEIVARRA